MALMTQVGLEFIARNRANRQISTFTRSIQRMGRQMLAIAGVGGGLYAVKRGFDYIIKAAMKQEDAVFLLGAALKTAGEYSAETMTKFEAFAASIQKVTIYGDEEVLALMQLMKSLGVTSAALEQATRMSIGLAAATGRDVRSMAMYVALAQQGEFTMLRRYIPALRKTTDATEQLQIVTDFAASGFKIAEAQAQTASGSWDQLKNATSDLFEIIGDPALDQMTIKMRNVKISIEGVSKGIKYLGEKVKDYKNILITPIEPDFMTTFPEIIRFEEEPQWLKNTLALNVMTEAQEKAAASMYEMSMKARGLGDELAREQKITQFSSLAKIRYAYDTAGAQAAIERYKQELEGTTKESVTMTQKYLSIIQREIDITGRIGEAHYHAAKMVDFENAIRKEGLEGTREGINLMEQMKDKLKELESAQRLARIADDIGSSFANAFEDMAIEAKKFEDVMWSVMRSIARSVMQNLVFQPVGLAITGAIRGGFRAMFPSGGMPTVGSVTPQAGATLVRYQHGGWAMQPQIARLAEREPELVTPMSKLGDLFKGGGGDLTFILNYMGMPMDIARVEQRQQEDQRIIEVWANNVTQGGTARRIIREEIANVE